MIQQQVLKLIQHKNLREKKKQKTKIMKEFKILA